MVMSTSFSYGRKGSDIVSAFLSATTADRAAFVLMTPVRLLFQDRHPRARQQCRCSTAWRMCYGGRFVGGAPAAAFTAANGRPEDERNPAVYRLTKSKNCPIL